MIMLAQIAEKSLHIYEKIPLDKAGYVLGIGLILGHLVPLLAPEKVGDFLRKAPRNEILGQVTLGIALFWFFLLVAPSGDSWLSALRTDLPGFENLRFILQCAVPVFFVLMVYYVKDFLFARSLGVLGLLVTSPLLNAAFIKEPDTRLLISVWCYLVIFMSFFWIGKPYIMREQVTWLLAKPMRLKALSLGGLVYGIAVLFCAAMYW